MLTSRLRDTLVDRRACARCSVILITHSNGDRLKSPQHFGMNTCVHFFCPGCLDSYVSELKSVTARFHFHLERTMDHILCPICKENIYNWIKYVTGSEEYRIGYDTNKKAKRDNLIKCKCGIRVSKQNMRSHMAKKEHKQRMENVPPIVAPICKKMKSTSSSKGKGKLKVVKAKAAPKCKKMKLPCKNKGKGPMEDYISSLTADINNYDLNELINMYYK